jgi:hypothetical protein
MNWFDLAEDRDQWSALVNVVMNRRVPQNSGNDWRLLKKDSVPWS